MSEQAAEPQYAPPEVVSAWRSAAPVWTALVSEWNGPDQEKHRQAFAQYIADDQQREVERLFAEAEQRALDQPQYTQAVIAGHNLADTLVGPHQDAVADMIEAPAAAEQTLSLEAVPDEPGTFA